MHLDDLVATKVAELVNGREVRYYIDVAAALQPYTMTQLLDLARRQDPSVDPTTSSTSAATSIDSTTGDLPTTASDRSRYEGSAGNSIIGRDVGRGGLPGVVT